MYVLIILICDIVYLGIEKQELQTLDYIKIYVNTAHFKVKMWHCSAGSLFQSNEYILSVYDLLLMNYDDG